MREGERSEGRRAGRRHYGAGSTDWDCRISRLAGRREAQAPYMSPSTTSCWGRGKNLSTVPASHWLKICPMGH